MHARNFYLYTQNLAKGVGLIWSALYNYQCASTLDISSILKLNYDITSIDSLIKLREDANRNRREDLGQPELIENTLYNELKLKAKVLYCEKEIDNNKSTLSKGEQEYQKYIEDLKRWEQKNIEIIGTAEAPETLEYYKHEIRWIMYELNPLLNELRNRRLALSKDIYRKKIEIKSFYDDVKTEISKKLSNYQTQGQNLTIDSSFSISSDFIDTFTSYILKNKIGSFKGQEEGKVLFKDKILDELNLNQESSVISFLSVIIDYLENDRRDNNGATGKPTFIGDQISKRLEFYTYLFSLGYIESHYELKQNGKSLDKLSPGEKGALLLIFYLILDRSEIPLIIDQPEDNLDNHSVAMVLVPFIQMAKKQRQIIMVTHNPNLAVVSDAEQIIHVEIDKTEGNKFKYTSGSIEDVEINSKIVNVLEGTMPAFTKRKHKYFE